MRDEPPSARPLKHKTLRARPPDTRSLEPRPSQVANPHTMGPTAIRSDALRVSPVRRRRPYGPSRAKSLGASPLSTESLREQGNRKPKTLREMPPETQSPRSKTLRARPPRTQTLLQKQL